MTKDSGASVPDQALAVPAEPVARLGPPGFDPSRWLELAECCELLDGPSSDIDEAIDDLVSPPLPHDPNAEAPPPGFGEEPHLHLGYWGTPYTLSIDVAQSLVPDGWAIVVGTYHAKRGPFARLFPPGYSDSPLEHQEANGCATMAIALCAAALRARAAIATEGESATSEAGDAR